MSWRGYRTSKALAWIIKLESDAWLARCGNQVCGPSSFSEAKANAFAMAKGAPGDSAAQYLTLLRKRIARLDPGKSSGLAGGSRAAPWG
jgi:hypothetical protein